MDRERRLPPFAEDTLTLLREAVEDGDTGEDLSKEEAKAIIAADERFSETDAEETLDLLANRGYVYFLHEHVRITPTDD